MDKVILKKQIKKGDFKTGGEASSQLKDLLRKLGISSGIIRKIAVVTYELEMNIIIHSNGGEIRAVVNPEGVKLFAEDIGPGIGDLDKAFQPGFSTASDKIREMGFGAGMGLSNIKSYSDKLDVKTIIGEGTLIESQIHF